MYKVPCKKSMGMGWACCEGMLCSACVEVTRLNAVIAAPVQTQEPESMKLLRSLWSDEGLRQLMRPDQQRRIEECLAPVQPVAAPDGPYTFPIGEDGEYMILDKDGQQVGTVLYYHAAKVIADALAAPAAQGDAENMEYWLEARQAHCLGQHRRLGDIIDAAIAAKAAS